MTVRTRFAPSPTGVLHIGSVRTALFNWLYARHCGGEFVLRVEDTDRQRSTQASVDTILDGMHWLGLTADEAPIFQSSRFDRYRDVSGELLANGEAYRCTCSRERLDTLRETQRARGDKTRYDGHCRDLALEKSDKDFVVRFKNPSSGSVRFHDSVKGDIEFANDELDDLVILRADNTPTYNFTVVVDDADMQISHVIRGDDHLNNTPRQINLYQALGHTQPQFAHLPMILGDDGAKLSKRHGAVNVLDYREGGYLPAAMLNYLVRLGWSHGDQEIFQLDEMIALFDIADVNASASAFNPGKLDWMNQQYLQSADSSDLEDLLQAQYDRLGVDSSDGPAAASVIDAYKERCKTLAEMAEATRYLFVDAIEIDPAAAKKHLRGVVQAPLQALQADLAALSDWNSEAIGSVVEGVAARLEVGMGKVGQPLRVAATGQSSSPGIGETLTLLGKSRTLQRLDAALGIVAERMAANS